MNAQKLQSSKYHALLSTLHCNITSRRLLPLISQKKRKAPAASAASNEGSAMAARASSVRKCRKNRIP